MIPEPAWPEHIKSALKDGRFELVLAWIDDEHPPNAALLKASLYEWWGKPLDAVEVLTRVLKNLPLHERSSYTWYRGLMYIQASMPAWAEQDFDTVFFQSHLHPNLTRLARAYAKVLLGDALGALEAIEGVPHDTVLALDRIVTPSWIEHCTMASLRRTVLKERNDDDAMI